MTRSYSIKWVCLVFGTLLLTVPLAAGQSAKADRHGFIAAQPEELQPAGGASQIVLFGDPTKPGLYVVRNTFPAGRMSRPHFHSQDRHVTVIKGTWWVSLGPESDGGDTSKMVPMKAGSYVFHPANGHHFDGAKDEEAVVQITGMGPVTTTQLKTDSGRGQR
jgi:quercetin dioxygenase-like cupin family protein